MKNEDLVQLIEIQQSFRQLFDPSDYDERDLPGNGGRWTYLKWQKIRERIDRVAPFANISYSTPVYLGDYCIITCTIEILGVSKQGIGNAEIQLLSNSGKNMARGTPCERATADALKSAAEAWGIGRELDDQSDPSKKAAFAQYVYKKSGNGKAIADYHRAQSNLPPKSDTPARSQAKPFGGTATNVVPIAKAEPVKPTTPQPISPEQVRRFWIIAREHKWTEPAVRLLIGAWSFSSTKEITTSAYEGLCAKLADPEMLAVYLDRLQKEGAIEVEF